MARRAKKETEAEGQGVSALRGNGFDKGYVASIVERVESVQAEIDEIMWDAKANCTPKREDIAAIKKEATDAGLPRKELNAILSKRRKLRAAEAIRDSLSAEQQDNFDNLEQALGMLSDTPLGQAALDKAKPPAEQPSEATT